MVARKVQKYRKLKQIAHLCHNQKNISGMSTLQ